jgi:hypothetical protein
VAVERCPTCGRRHKRSHPQNARYWLLIHAIADKIKPQNVQHSPEVWHCYFKSKFIGCDEVVMPNKKTLLLPRSSADLDVGEFAEYMTQVEQWAGEHDVWLADMEAV